MCLKKIAAFNFPKKFFICRDEIVFRMRRHGVLLGGCGDSSVRLRPCLTFAPRHAAMLLERLETVMGEVQDGVDRRRNNNK